MPTLCYEPKLAPYGACRICAVEIEGVEGTREWHDEIVMSDEVRALVDRRWDDYGIDLGTAARADGRRQSSRSLRDLLRR